MSKKSGRMTKHQKASMVKKYISTLKTTEDVKEYIGLNNLSNDPDLVLHELKKELSSETGQPVDIDSKSNFYKALTLFEFDKGILMSATIPKRYKTFCIDFSRNLQKEYQCETPSEKATAELVAVNFVRTLEIQFRINWRLEKGEFGEIGVKYLAILSKELDRANRHYLSALQTLKMIKQPALEVNIKTKTAVVGQNQIVQSNNK